MIMSFLEVEKRKISFSIIKIFIWGMNKWLFTVNGAFYYVFMENMLSLQCDVDLKCK